MPAASKSRSRILTNAAGTVNNGRLVSVVAFRLRILSVAAFGVSDSQWVLCRFRHKTHWTRHPSRLDRDLGRQHWGDEGYAKEELVAELGSAFLCADLQITPEVRDDHASYIHSWLTVLKNDKRAIFTAASHATNAVDYLHALQPMETQVPATE